MALILTAPGMKTHQFTYIHNSMFLEKLAETFDKRYGEIVKWWIYSDKQYFSERERNPGGQQAFRGSFILY